MDAFTNFLANNYVWFLIISLILLFALIGYLVDVKETKNGKRVKKKKEDLKIVDFSKVEQGKSLNQSLKEDTNSLNLDEYKKNTANIVQEEPKEELKEENLGAIDMDAANELPDLDLEEKKEIENEFQ